MEDEFLTVREVADLLKINQQTIRNWIDRGDFPAVRVGPRRVRIRRVDLDAFLAAGSSSSDAHEDGTDLDQHIARRGLGDALDRARSALDGAEEAQHAQALRGLAKA